MGEPIEKSRADDSACLHPRDPRNRAGVVLYLRLLSLLGSDRRIFTTLIARSPWLQLNLNRSKTVASFTFAHFYRGWGTAKVFKATIDEARH